MENSMICAYFFWEYSKIGGNNWEPVQELMAEDKELEVDLMKKDYA